MVSLINWFTDDIKKIIWFNKWFSVEMFEDMNKLVAMYISFCGKMAITINDKSLEIFNKVELQSLMQKYQFNFVNNKLIPYIDYNMPRALEQALPTVAELLVATVQNYLNVPRGESFKLDVALALKQEREERTRMVFLQATQKLSTSYDSKCVEDSKSKLAEIDKVYGEDCLSSLSIMTGDVEDIGEEQSSLLFGTGIPTLDADLHGGISTGNIIAMVGQPKAGKTRLMCNMIYRAMLNGVNVYLDSAEMSESRIRNTIIAIHCHHVYNMIVPDELMRTDIITQEQKNIIKVARNELFGDTTSNQKLGRLIINHNVTVSNLKTNLLEAIELYKAQLYCLDYAGFVVPGDDKNLQKQAPYEWITRIYKDIHDVILTHNIGVIVLNQFNEKGITNISTGKELDSSCIEGGQAVSRTADYIMGLTYDPKTRLTARKLTIIQSRISAGFKNLTLRCNIGISDFVEFTGVSGGI